MANSPWLPESLRARPSPGGMLAIRPRYLCLPIIMGIKENQSWPKEQAKSCNLSTPPGPPRKHLATKAFLQWHMNHIRPSKKSLPDCRRPSSSTSVVSSSEYPTTLWINSNGSKWTDTNEITHTSQKKGKWQMTWCSSREAINTMRWRIRTSGARLTIFNPTSCQTNRSMKSGRSKTRWTRSWKTRRRNGCRPCSKEKKTSTAEASPSELIGPTWSRWSSCVRNTTTIGRRTWIGSRKKRERRMKPSCNPSAREHRQSSINWTTISRWTCSSNELRMHSWIPSATTSFRAVSKPRISHQMIYQNGVPRTLLLPWTRKPSRSKSKTRNQMKMASSRS